MLASKIADFPKLWPSKRPSKFHRFPYRFFIDLGSVLASNMGILGAKTAQNSEKWLQKVGTVLPKSSTNLCLKTVQEPFGLDFWRGQGWFFDDLWMIFWTVWLTLGMFSAALAGGATLPGPVTCVSFLTVWTRCYTDVLFNVYRSLALSANQ